MKLSEYVKRVGVTYKTGWNWFKAGKIKGAYQTETGTIIVPDSILDDSSDTSNQTKTVVYARVSSNEQRKTNLETQAERMVQFCLANGWVVDQIIKEVGSGLNDQRPKLSKLLMDPEVKRIVVEHKDRLTRFGFHYLELLAESNGFEIIVANKTLDSDKNDLMADFTSIITSFCARLYSQRRGKHKADKIKQSLKED